MYNAIKKCTQFFTIVGYARISLLTKATKLQSSVPGFSTLHALCGSMSVLRAEHESYTDTDTRISIGTIAAVAVRLL